MSIGSDEPLPAKRRCIFCGDRVFGKEDALPRWLLKRLAPSGGVMVEAERGGVQLLGWPQRTHEIPIGCTCETCNNGWMSRLESLVIPIIGPLLEDGPCSFEPSTQVTLAVWATKTAMVFEGLRSGSDCFYTFEQRAALRDRSELPARTSVWIAKCIDLPGVYCSASDLAESAQRGPNEVRAYVTTMAFGYVAIQVVTAHAPDFVPREVPLTTDVRPGPWDDATLRVWPNSLFALAWPPVGQGEQTGPIRPRVRPVPRLAFPLCTDS